MLQLFFQGGDNIIAAPDTNDYIDNNDTDEMIAITMTLL